VIGTAAAALSVLWPAGAELLIRFTGPELWWLSNVARWAAALPGASLPVPMGTLGAVTVGAAATVAIVVLRWRRTRLSGRHDTIGW
jgi:competence protein ComEC